MSDELPKGFDCPVCGNFARFTKWVYAHWDITIDYTCEQKHQGQTCGGVVTLRQGHIISVVHVQTRSKSCR